MTYEYRQVELSNKILPIYSSLLSIVFSNRKKFTPQFLNWQYVQNPVGSVLGFDAWEGEILAAHYVAIPVQYYFFGKLKRGLLSLNTATHPKHRGKGLFICLAEYTFAMAKDLGYEFVIGVANQNSTKGFVNRLAFHLVSPLNVLVGIGSVVAKKNVSTSIYADHSSEYLKWRLSNPSQKYFRHGKLILTDTDKLSIKAIVSSQNEADNSLSSTGIVPFKLWIGLANAIEKRGIFFGLPDFLRPSPLNLVFRDLQSKSSITKKEEIFFELIDFDAY